MLQGEDPSEDCCTMMGVQNGIVNNTTRPHLFCTFVFFRYRDERGTSHAEENDDDDNDRDSENIDMKNSDDDDDYDGVD